MTFVAPTFWFGSSTENVTATERAPDCRESAARPRPTARAPAAASAARRAPAGSPRTSRPPPRRAGSARSSCPPRSRACSRTDRRSDRARTCRCGSRRRGAGVAGGRAGILRDAARERDAPSRRSRSVDLARQACSAVDLARARVTELAGRGVTDAVLVTRVAVTAVRRALALRNTRRLDALQRARAVAAVATVIADRAIPAGTPGKQRPAPTVSARRIGRTFPARKSSDFRARSILCPQPGGIMRFGLTLLTLLAGTTLAHAGAALDDDKKPTRTTDPNAAPDTLTTSADKVECGRGLPPAVGLGPAEHSSNLFVEQSPGGIQNWGWGFDARAPPRQHRAAARLRVREPRRRPKACGSTRATPSRGDERRLHPVAGSRAGQLEPRLVHDRVHVHEPRADQQVRRRSATAAARASASSAASSTAGTSRAQPSATNANPDAGLRAGRSRLRRPGHRRRPTATARRDQPAKYNLPPVFPVVNAIIGLQIKPTAEGRDQHRGRHPHAAVLRVLGRLLLLSRT